MIPIIDPVDRTLILKELTADKLLRKTNNGGNEIYVVTARNSPNIMQELGRLRELSFRDAGGGTGAAVDIDAEDTAEEGYQQLFVWDPKAQEIVGGYRFIVSRTPHPKHMSTEHYFRFSDKFRNEFLPYTIELGRSFVQPLYQGIRQNPKGLYSLDNLWDGLGALVVTNPDMKYFFGKVTMYGDYNKEARDLLIYFLKKYFPDRDKLVDPIYPIELDIDNEAKTVHPILPEIQIKQPVLDEKQFSFMPDDANIDLKTVIKTCKVDVVKEVKADKNLYSVAGDNLKQAVTGLITPIAEAEDYEIVWE